jgi:hypothetical protein
VTGAVRNTREAIDERHGGVVIITRLLDYLDDLRRRLFDDHHRFLFIVRALLVTLRRRSRRFREKGVSDLSDHRFSPIGRNGEPLGIGGATRRRKHLVEHFRSERGIDLPTTGGLNPGAPQGAESILEVILDEA